MKVRALRENASLAQRGFALIALLALAALIASFLIASALNLTSAGNSNEREDRSMSALRKAKAALIAYAASEQWQLYKTPSTYFQPGALPCPDQDDDGDADCFGSNTASMIGRVPFKTLGIDDLRDASGERLWYALSHDFRKNQCPGTGCTTINSDTLGQLTVTGTAPATQVVAIVFAPGQAIQGQTRDPTNASVHNDPLNYLDGPPNLSNPVNYIFTTSALPSDTFNDRVLVITQAELMAAVEPVVAARIERDIKLYITQNYSGAIAYVYGEWKWIGGYPFAVPWGGGPVQPQDDYKGDAATPTYRGLMPVTRDAANWVRWDTSSISVTQLAGGTGGYGTGTLTIGPTDCSASTGSQISCRIDFPGGSNDRPQIRLQATLLNAARTFVNAMAPGNETVRDNGGADRGWSNTISPNPWTVSSSLQANGNGTIVFEGRLVNANSMANRATITVPAPSYHPISDSADTTSGWFIANQWYRQVFYAVSENGGVPGCNPRLSPPTPPTSPSCLRVNNLPPSYATPDDKRAILVFAGRELNGLTPRPANLANYLESANLTAANGTTPFVYEHRTGVPTTINDRVVVVSP